MTIGEDFYDFMVHFSRNDFGQRELKSVDSILIAYL